MAKNSKKFKTQKRNANRSFLVNLEERRAQKQGEPKTVNLHHSQMAKSLVIRVYDHIKNNLWGQPIEIGKLPGILKTLPFALPKKQKFLEPDHEGYIKVLVDYGGDRFYLDINLQQLVEGYNTWWWRLKNSKQPERNYAVM